MPELAQQNQWMSSSCINVTDTIATIQIFPNYNFLYILLKDELFIFVACIHFHLKPINTGREIAIESVKMEMNLNGYFSPKS